MEELWQREEQSQRGTWREKLFVELRRLQHVEREG